MNELMYSFRDNNVRVVMKDNEPWFVMNDVCEVLDIKNARDAYSRLEEHEKGVGSTDSYNSPINIVNEYGMYSLIFTSRKPEAKEFKNWVTREVLPSIRKHGAYATDVTLEKMVSDPDFAIKLLTKLKEEKELREGLNRQLEQQKPKVLLADSITSTNGMILIRDLANILTQNGFKIGQNKLYDLLRQQGYIQKNNTSPTQRAMNIGLFFVEEKEKNGILIKTTKVTTKGQEFFINKFIK